MFADDAFLGGAASLRLDALSVGDGGPVIDLMTVVPNRRSRPAPVFLVMNFCGNQAVTRHPDVPLARGWVPGVFCAGCPDNAATEAARGAQVDDWPLERLVARGYAVATFCSSDVDSDRADVSDGVYRWLAGGDPARNPTTSRGTLAAWAWGFHRCIDHLTTDPAIDPARIATVGHSRNGKAALLAAAYDERVAMAIANQAGCGGSAPSRVAPELAAPTENGPPIVETLREINERFPHWFNDEFKTFVDDPGRLPFDQNGLVAMCAPRPVLFANARDDHWANPGRPVRRAARRRRRLPTARRGRHRRHHDAGGRQARRRSPRLPPPRRRARDDRRRLEHVRRLRRPPLDTEYTHGMADVTTMKISTGTRDRLRALGTDGDTLEDVVVAALDAYESQQFWAEAEAAAAAETPGAALRAQRLEADTDAWMDSLH